MAYTGNQTFGGLDARRAASDGAIRDMSNMSLRFSPALASRTGRRVLATGWMDFGGAYYGERDFVVRGGALYDDGEYVCALTTGEKSIAALEGNLYIFPDKVVYNTVDRTVRNYAAETIAKTDNDGWGWAYIVPHSYIDGEYKDVLYITHDKSYSFKDGELLRLTITKTGGTMGATKDVDYGYIMAPTYNGTGKGSGQAFHEILYPDATFYEIGTSGKIRIEMTLSHAIPDMDFVFSSDNRLWGAKGREIYASALGQGMVWMDYDTLATSSWAATTKTGDKITAALDFGGTPVFFAENAVYKIYGENPKEYQYARQDIIGITAGDHKSAAVGAGYIYYLTRRGVYAWTGGIPQLISAPLGEERITDAVGGSDGAVYYLSCRQNGRHNLYCFDPLTNIWVREDELDACDIRLRGHNLCAVTKTGDVYLIGDVYDEDGIGEHPITYSMETADYNDGAVVQKSAKNILIQHELDGGTADVMVSYDGEPWHCVYTLYDTYGKKITSVIPLHPKQYRTMRIRIAGDGSIVIYYMMRDVTAHTERPGGETNVYV